MSDKKRVIYVGAGARCRCGAHLRRRVAGHPAWPVDGRRHGCARPPRTRPVLTRKQDRRPAKDGTCAQMLMHPLDRDGVVVARAAACAPARRAGQLVVGGHAGGRRVQTEVHMMRVHAHRGCERQARAARLQGTLGQPADSVDANVQSVHGLSQRPWSVRVPVLSS